MPHRFQFDPATLISVASGTSVIDLPRLAIETEEQASRFLLAYGFDVNHAADLDRLWYFHRRALVFLQEKLGFSAEEIPEELRDRKWLGDLRNLLIFASSTDPRQKERQKWACALLRTMHVFVHAESDLFASFAADIQRQVLSPFQQSIFTEGTTGTQFLRGADRPHLEQIALDGFEIKPFKTSTSTVIKLLAKPDAVAMRVFDKLGVRFITRSMFDSFRVIRFLIEENIVSFPHIMPDQSSNNIYPAELFCDVCLELAAGENKNWTDEELDEIFHQRLQQNKKQVLWLRKENSFSGEDYRVIKFIARRLIRISPSDKGTPFSFFFPYEVQILDRRSFARIQSGPSEHHQYKERQRSAARRRLFSLPEEAAREPAER
ncbi:MAG: TIGR04552 family protein [Bdellovibrio sp.]|nr:MAG: TIGR04552 family protein [Bdellovibrio sp.]